MKIKRLHHRVTKQVIRTQKKKHHTPTTAELELSETWAAASGPRDGIYHCHTPTANYCQISLETC